MNKHITIDACSLCQLKCPRCPATEMGYPFNIGRGHLKFADFRQLVDDTRPARVDFDCIGEMFLNPDLLSILEYAFSKKVLLFGEGANLNRADERVLEGLVKYQFQRLTCSMDGVSQETYGAYRVGGILERVLENVRTINRYKKQYGSAQPRLIWQFIVFGYNEHELPLARKMARDLGMDFFPKTSWDSQYSPIRNQEFVLRETGWPATTREEYELVTGRSYARSACATLWHSPRINWDGRVLGCCWNTWSEFGGNVFRDGYAQAIRSERLQYAKRMLLGQAAPREDIPCCQCKLFHKIVESKKYFTLEELFPSPAPRVNALPGWYRVARFVYRASGLKAAKYWFISKRNALAGKSSPD